MGILFVTQSRDGWIDFYEVEWWYHGTTRAKTRADACSKKRLTNVPHSFILLLKLIYALVDTGPIMLVNNNIGNQLANKTWKYLHDLVKKLPVYEIRDENLEILSIYYAWVLSM